MILVIYCIILELLYFLEISDQFVHGKKISFAILD